MNTLYQHPDGHSLVFAENTLTIVTCDGVSASVPIGLGGLLQLNKRIAEMINPKEGGGVIAEKRNLDRGLQGVEL